MLVHFNLRRDNNFSIEDKIAGPNVSSMKGSTYVTGRYGVGYHMIMEKAPSSTSDKVVEVISLVRSHVRGAKCVLDAGAELAFILPAEDTKAFPSLLQELESNGIHC